MFLKSYKFFIIESIIVAVLTLILIKVHYDFNFQVLEKQLMYDGKDLVTNIENYLNRSASPLVAMQFHFDNDEDIPEEEFDKISDFYLNRYNNIAFFQHKNAMKETDMLFPKGKGYETILGSTFEGKSEFRSSVEKAINGKVVTGNDPYEMKFTDFSILGFITNAPVFYNGEFNGFFISVIDLGDFLSKIVNEYYDERYHIQLRDSRGNVFYTNNDNSSDKISYENEETLNIMDIQWKMDMKYREKYGNALIIQVTFLSTVIVLFFLIILVVQLRSFKKSRNINVLENLKGELIAKEERYVLAVAGAKDVIWEYDKVSGDVFISDRFLEIIEDKIDIENVQFKDFVVKEDYCDFMEALKKVVDGIEEYVDVTCRIKISSGKIKWVRIKGKSLKNSEGKVLKLAGSLSDVTQTVEYQRKIEYNSFHDSLTGINNRRYLSVEVDKYLESGNRECAIIFIDLDDFKRVNDLYGHSFGNKLLVTISKFLSELSNENAVLCRYGGDEFIYFIKEYSDEGQVQRFCKYIYSLFRNSFMVDNREINIRASLGVAFSPEDGNDFEELLKNADSALNEAKSKGKNNCVFFNEKIREKLERELDIELELKNAINNEEFYLNYQPQFNISNNEYVGIEALLRWKNKKLGIVPPDEFISIAEKTGEIISLGEWVIKEIFKIVNEWDRYNINYKRVALNVSPIQLNESFLKFLKSQIDKNKINPEKIVLEITENTTIDDLEYFSEFIKKLKALKLKIALDDFGVGYSSLSYLTSLKVNILKIDKSIIEKISFTNGKNLLEGIIKLGKSIDLEIISEGVERESEIAVLRDFDCNIVQGYYFMKPVSKEKIEKVIMEGYFNREKPSE